LDDRVLIAHPGETVFKPRNVRHAFWNASDGLARILEMITPAGFNYFAEVGDVFDRPGHPDAVALASIASRYGLMMERNTVPELIAKHGLAP
jgi:hypothetical protein